MKINQEVIYSHHFTNFLKNKENAHIYENYLEEKTINHTKQLNEAYKSYERDLIISSYLNKVISFEAKRFDKKLRTESKLICSLDEQIGEDITLVDTLVDEKSEEDFDNITLNNELDELFEELCWKQIFDSLTKRQKEILKMIYMLDLPEKEVARSLRITQQAVSKTHCRALKKIKELVHYDTKY